MTKKIFYIDFTFYIELMFYKIGKKWRWIESTYHETSEEIKWTR